MTRTITCFKRKPVKTASVHVLSSQQVGTEALERHFPACKFVVSTFCGFQVLQFSPFLVCKFAVFILSCFANLQISYFPSLQIRSFSHILLVCKFALFTKLLRKLMTWVLITWLANHVRSVARKWRRSSYCGAYIQRSTFHYL